MADSPSQYADDDLLSVQLEARERASREDAAVFGQQRSRAAARALGLSIPPPPDRIDPADDDIELPASVEPELLEPPVARDELDPAVVGDPVLDETDPIVDVEILVSRRAGRPVADRPRPRSG